MRNVLVPALIVLLGAVGAGAGEERDHAAAKVDDSRFEFLRSLEGSWVAKSDTEMDGGRFEFRVTAGGTAIEEREMIDTPMEMLTVYHMDGKELVGTHYCAMGNQPRVKAARKVANNTLDFACDGTPGNEATHDAAHIHGWSMRLNDDGTLTYSAEMVQEGEVTEAPTLVLFRDTKTASR